jgi:hypothetical protein
LKTYDRKRVLKIRNDTDHAKAARITAVMAILDKLGRPQQFNRVVAHMLQDEYWKRTGMMDAQSFLKILLKEKTLQQSDFTSSD